MLKQDIIVDSSFFEMFDYQWVEGSPKQALKQPYTVVLTKKVRNAFSAGIMLWGKLLQSIIDSVMMNF